MAEVHDLDTHEAMARVLGSRMLATRSRTCHGIVEAGGDVLEVAIGMELGMLVLMVE